MRRKLPFPKAIREAPELRIGLSLFYLAFSDLSSSRSIGMAAGFIPWGVIEQYCRCYDLTEEQTDDMHYHIKQMDVVWHEYQKVLADRK